MSVPLAVTLDELVGLISDRMGSSRQVVGLVGSPGSGKSTMAEDLVRSLGEKSVIVGMDGFHLGSAILADLGLSTVKGAPATFDAAGFVALLCRIRDQQSGETVYAPIYDRAHGEPIGSSRAITMEHRAVVVDGNYLLMDGPWSKVRDLLTISVFLTVDPDLRIRRLIERHISFGRSEQAAREWAYRSDEANARVIEPTSEFADYIVTVT